jgi:ribose/xylose/arabinose/galactoside ABC-type transport system permease subunit
VLAAIGGVSHIRGGAASVEGVVRIRLARKQIPLAATIVVFALLYGAACARYKGFGSPTVFVNFLADNAFLGIAAIGETFVILSGGIDLSVGAMIGFTSILVAVLIDQHSLHPALAIALALVLGALFGRGMGALIRYWAMPPFLVTLGGMFLARGLGFVISLQSIPITHPVYERISGMRLPLGSSVSIPMTAIAFLAVVAVGVFVSQYTRFGRNVYAVGGDEKAAVLMGLPVGPTKTWIYTVSGFCSALAGVVYTFYSSSGYPNAGVGLELDAIAAVVIGGTPLTGGVGYVFGTLMGVLIQGIIQTAIMFQGTLSSWWTRIAIGLLLLGFILLQRILSSRTR